MMDQAAAQLAQDNCELACCFIQKTAVEKAGPEMDKRLATVSVQHLPFKFFVSCLRKYLITRTSVTFFHSQEFELRKHARQEGRRYCDPVVLTYQAERMPEQIRLKVRIGGCVSSCPICFLSVLVSSAPHWDQDNGVKCCFKEGFSLTLVAFHVKATCGESMDRAQMCSLPNLLPVVEVLFL